VLIQADKTSEIQHTQRRCLACDEDRTTPWHRELVRCRGCGLIFYPPRLGREQQLALYGEDYFRGAEYRDYLADRAAHEANFRQRIRQLRRWLPRGSRLFEIGCSYGLFLNLARTDWRVRGCDIATEPCRYATDQLGLDVRCCDFLDVPLEPGEVDAFCMWDTIEHLDDPAGYLARIARILPDDGLMTLTTGDIGSLLARVQGPRWRQIHPPTHLWYFSEATLRRALERFALDVVCAKKVGMARSIGQVVYSLTSLDRARPSDLYTLCERSGLGRLTFSINTYDLIHVVAKRRPHSTGPARTKVSAS
jgi:SAM-dependent methyltransferase